MQTRPNTALWMGLAFAVAAAGALLVIAVLGAGERGTDDALLLSGRISFLLFWPAYVGGAMVTLFGSAFQPLKRRGREFGLAFASAHLVHVALVAWLCRIGATPATSVFVFFGTALACLYLLALGSIAQVRRALGPVGWRILQIFGMNYIAYAFATDFVRFNNHGGMKYWLAYAPFAALSVGGPGLVLASLLLRSARSLVPARPAVLPGPGFRPWRR